MNLIPEGTWRARGVAAELGYTSQDHEQVGVLIQFSPDQDVDVDDRQLTWYGQFTEKSEPHTLKALRVCGWVGENLADLTSIDGGVEIEAVVVHEDDLQGQPRARVRFLNPIGAGGVAMKAKMSEEQAKAFAERMRGRVLASAAKTPAPATTKPAAAPPPRAATAARQAKRTPAAAEAPEDDQIPF